jgi:hypothetical protein
MTDEIYGQPDTVPAPKPKRERTAEEIAAAKERMAKVRAGKGKQPKPADQAKIGIGSGHHADAATENRTHRGRAKRDEHPDDEFPGMTANDCCQACYASGGKHCAITHEAFCGHPMKGGIQSKHMLVAEIVARYNRAKTKLAHMKIDARAFD